MSEKSRQLQQGEAILREKARQMRESPTPAEALLWQHLRQSQLGDFKFRRKYVAAPFLVNFYCVPKKLVIEVVDSIEEQQNRKARLQEKGYQVLQFETHAVLQDTAHVLKEIRQFLDVDNVPRVRHPRPDRKALFARARKMRNAPTPAEALLWQHLRASQLDGYKFRRKHVVRSFIVDFYCPARRMVVDIIDGSIKDRPNPEDAHWPQVLQKKGYRVYQVRVEDVLQDVEHILDEILSFLIYGHALEEPDPQDVHKLMKERARRMRNAPTPAEARLWRRLRGSQLGGCRFSRQVVIEAFIVDFYCKSRKLVVEVDGAVHEEQKTYDLYRDYILKEKGCHVLRFTNEAVMMQINDVLDEIMKALTAPVKIEQLPDDDKD